MICKKCGKDNYDNANFCTGCGYNLKEDILNTRQNNISNRRIQNRKAHNKEKNIKTYLSISILVTIILGILSTVVPLYTNNAYNNDLVSSNIYLYDMFEYMIDNKEYINLIPIILLFISSIAIIISSIFCLIYSIQILAYTKNEEIKINKSFYMFIISFITFCILGNGYIIDSGYIDNMMLSNLTIIGIIVSFGAILSYYFNILKLDKKLYMYKIINFILIVILYILLLNSSVKPILNNYAMDEDYFYVTYVEYHPIAYLISTFSNKSISVLADLGISKKTEFVVGTVIYAISYITVGVTLAIIMASIVNNRKYSKKNIITLGIFGAFSLIFSISELIFSTNSVYSFSYNYTSFLIFSVIFVIFNSLCFSRLKKE